MPKVGDVEGLTLASRGLTTLESTTKITGTLQTGTDAQNLSNTYINMIMDDISTAGSSWVVSPVAGTISLIQCVIDGAIITANAVITGKINGASITNGVITVTQAGSAAGDVDTATPTAANTVAVGDKISMTTNGASGNTVRANFTFTILRS